MAVYRSLENKRVVITGGGSGIGLASAHRFIAEQAKVVIVDINPDALTEATKALPQLTGTICTDVSKPEQITQVFKTVDELMAGIDVLISNAGISIRNPFTEITFEQWYRTMRVNLDSMFLYCHEAVSRMQLQKSGVILLTGSTNGLEGHQLYTDYNASKAAVINLAKTLALELAPLIRVNAVCPGYVLTAMQKAEYTPEMLEKVNEKIPLNRHADPAEVAALFAFLASSEASYITGQAISIDGGETAGPYIPGLK